MSATRLARWLAVPLVVSVVAAFAWGWIPTYRGPQPQVRALANRLWDRRIARFTPSTYRFSCGWRLAIGCRELPPLAGQLAPLADSALAAVPTVACVGFPSTTMAGLGQLGLDRPYLSCWGVRPDTTVSVSLDLAGLVIDVDRGWAPRAPIETHRSLVRRMERQFGPGHLCPPSDDRTFTDDWRWQLPTVNIGVYLAARAQVHVVYFYGRLACHTV
jgi:hypothetical protein